MAPSDDSREAERILFDQTLSADERAAKLMPVVYSQLRAIAQREMAGERVNHTLQPTALINEAFLKLFGNRQIPWQNRAHFCVAAAEAMRQVLLDHARARKRLKRGGGGRKLPLDLVDLAVEGDPDLIVALNDLLDQLRAENPEVAGIVDLRFYAGRSLSEISKMLDIPERTLDRRWKFARAWLLHKLGERDERRSDETDDAP